MDKKKENLSLIKSLEYISIVDDMSEEAFNFCVSNLYSLFEYKVIKQEEVRRVDLKEKLVGLEKQIPADEKEYHGMLDYYFWIMKVYFKDIINCKSRSRAEKYRKRVYEAMNDALSENGTIEDVDDVFLGFMVLFRAYKNDQTYIEPSFGIEGDDIKLLEYLRDKTKIKRKKVFDPNTGLDDKAKTASKIMYINNIIFLSRALQHFGGYQEENKK